MDGGDNVCILDRPKIQVAQLKKGSTVRFSEVTDTHLILVPIIYVPDYLTVGSGSVPGAWAVVPSIRDLPKVWTISPTDQFQ